MAAESENLKREVYNLVAPTLSRRAFIQEGALIMLTGLTAFGQSAGALSASADRSVARIGLITDLHYADTPDRGARNYRESLTKASAAVLYFNAQKPDFVVELGDMIDALPMPTAESEAQFLTRIQAEFARLKMPRHYVLGNHCIYSLTKPRFLNLCAQRKSYYAFDKGNFHFVVLDACYRKDGVDYGNLNFDWTDTDVPLKERNWLAADLKATKRKTVVFIHQRLDVPADKDDAVHSASAVRQVMEESGKVLAVFQGHSHVNDYQQINGIHYCTLDAVVGGTGSKRLFYTGPLRRWKHEIRRIRQTCGESPYVKKFVARHPLPCILFKQTRREQRFRLLPLRTRLHFHPGERRGKCCASGVSGEGDDDGAAVPR